MYVLSIRALKAYLGSGRPVGPSGGRSGFHRGVLLIVYAGDTGSNGLFHVLAFDFTVHMVCETILTC
jgi:hypothetical protein